MVLRWRSHLGASYCNHRSSNLRRFSSGSPRKRKRMGTLVKAPLQANTFRTKSLRYKVDCGEGEEGEGERRLGRRPANKAEANQVETYPYAATPAAASVYPLCVYSSYSVSLSVVPLLQLQRQPIRCSCLLQLQCQSIRCSCLLQLQRQSISPRPSF